MPDTATSPAIRLFSSDLDGTLLGNPESSRRFRAVWDSMARRERPAQRRALEAITHPEVERLRQEALARARADGLALVVCDIPLLFEVGLERQMDRVVVVDAPTEVRRLRLMRDRGLSAADADAMIAAQWPAESKRARADYVIDNDGTLAQLE